MIDNTVTQLAFRARAATLSVATTGSTTLSASATGYARAAGSFVADGFVVGMELAASGFTVAGNNGPHVIASVTALALSCTGCAIDGAAVGRTITVGLPGILADENLTISPDPTRPYLEEDYAPATNRGVTFPLQGGVVEETGLYVLKWYGLANTGIASIRKGVDALKALFAPGTTIASGPNTVYVRSDVGPWSSQLLPQGNGFTVCTLTVPWRARTSNTIAP